MLSVTRTASQRIAISRSVAPFFSNIFQNHGKNNRKTWKSEPEFVFHQTFLTWAFIPCFLADQFEALIGETAMIGKNMPNAKKAHEFKTARVNPAEVTLSCRKNGSKCRMVKLNIYRRHLDNR
jgi:hypothetical protein